MALIASGDLPAIQIGGRGQWRIERAEHEDNISAAYAKARVDIARGDIDAADGAAEMTRTHAWAIAGLVVALLVANGVVTDPGKQVCDVAGGATDSRGALV